MSRDVLPLVFFHQKLLLAPLDMPWKDLSFFRIFRELFVFVIDSLVYSSWGSWGSPVYSALWSRRSPMINTPWSRPKLVCEKPADAKYTRSQNSTVINKLGSLYSLFCLSPEVFFVNLFWCLFQIHQEVSSPVYSQGGHFGYWGVILPILMSIRQPSKGLSF